jgi:hypothetical protein
MFFGSSKRFEKSEVVQPRPYSDEAVVTAGRHTAIGAVNLSMKFVDSWKQQHQENNNRSSPPSGVVDHSLASIGESPSTVSARISIFDKHTVGVESSRCFTVISETPVNCQED